MVLHLLENSRDNLRSHLFLPVWRRVRILPPESLRVERGDGKGTELVSGETVPADLREG
jgi:hypothetical protein